MCNRYLSDTSSTAMTAYVKLSVNPAEIVPSPINAILGMTNKFDLKMKMIID